MIILRYLTRQLVLSTTAVTLILVMILISARFIRYLTLAAAGELATDILFPLVYYRLPEMLELVLPLSLFLGILFSYSRMYLDNEMTALFFSGLSRVRLMLYTLPVVLSITLLVAYLSFVGGPQGLNEVDRLFSANAARTEFDGLLAGRFEPMGDEGRVVYAQTISDKRTRLHDVFIHEPNTARHNPENLQQTLLIAEQGHLQKSDTGESRFLILENGFRVDGVPGNPDYRITQFATYGARIPDPIARDKPQKPRSKSTLQLFSATSATNIAELEWRFSLPLLVPIVALLGVVLSRVDPREGRYFRIFLALLIYAGYLVLLTVTRSSVEEGQIAPFPGLWQVHLWFLIFALILASELYRYLPSLQKFRR